jgi:hypothetical protein
MSDQRKALSKEECAHIREMLHNGESHNSIAKKVGRAQSTISAFAQREGINPVNRTPQSAIDRRREFALQERVEAADELLAKVLEVARSASTGREVKECAVAFGVLVDKKNLMEGLPSSRHELHSTRATATIDLAQEFAKIDQQLQEETSCDLGEEEFYGAGDHDTLSVEAPADPDNTAGLGPA